MKKIPEHADAFIGQKIKSRRKLLGFSPQQLAGLLGISYQQLYKYENGQNRVSASVLGKMAVILNIPVEYFFSDKLLPFGLPINDSFRAGQIANEPETKALVKGYIAIADPRTRSAIVELVTSITKYLAKRAS